MPFGEIHTQMQSNRRAPLLFHLCMDNFAKHSAYTRKSQHSKTGRYEIFSTQIQTKCDAIMKYLLCFKRYTGR